MKALSSWRLTTVIAGGALALAVALPDFAGAVDSETPVLDSPKTQTRPAPKSTTKDSKTKKPPKKNDKKSQQEFLDGYRAAHALIYQRNDFAAGINKLKSLGYDDNPDVANLLGFSNRKLGAYEEAKFWYERALASDPKHVRTWSYYGMWYAEQGNLEKAVEFLAKVESLCGTQCREYTELLGVIDGTGAY
jgi:tetratricopeptide (TPR) repeat protein